MALSNVNNNVYDALAPMLFVARIQLVPLVQRKTTAAFISTAFLNAILVLSILLYGTFTLYFMFHTFPGRVESFFRSNGYLFFSLVVSDYLFNKFIFLYTVVHMNTRATSFANFLQRIHRIDCLFQQKFGNHVQHARDQRWKVFCPLLVILTVIIYFCAFNSYNFSHIPTLNVTGMHGTVVSFYLEYSTFLLANAIYASCVLIIRREFIELECVVKERISPQQLPSILSVYDELFGLVPLLGAFAGGPLYLDMLHKCVLTTIMTYMTFGILMDRNSSWIAFVKIALWSNELFSQICLICLATSLTKRAVHLFAFSPFIYFI